MIRAASFLMRFFPVGFRARYGDEVLEVLQQRAIDVRRREGVLGWLRLSVFQLADLVRSAYVERRTESRRGRRPAHGSTRRAGVPHGDAAPGGGGNRSGWEDLGRDVRHALRLLARAPGFTIVVIITLGLGIAATTAIFAVIDGVLLEPLPYQDPGELVAVYSRIPGLSDRIDHTDSAFLTYHDDNRVFAHIGAWAPGEAVVSGTLQPERVDVVAVSDRVFAALAVRPLFGRGFLPEDTATGAPTTVVLSHAYWASRFGADRSVLGETLRVAGETAEIVGVMGPEFRFLDEDASLYIPLRLDRGATATVLSFDYRVIARLLPGVTLAAAERDLQRLVPVSVDRYGWTSPKQLDEWALGINIIPLKDSIVADVAQVLWILLGTVSVVLLMACANVANLMMVRAEERRREIAMRTALGASRGRLAWQFFVESCVVGMLAALAGLVLAYLAVPVFIRLAPAAIPRAGEIAIDGTVLLFTMLVSIGASLSFGLIPVLQQSFTDLVPALKEGGGAGSGRSSLRARNALAVAEVALALVLLVGAGLMVRSFQALRSVDPGLADPQQVMTFRLSLPTSEAPDNDRAIAVYEQIVARISAVPGVTHVGAVSGLTMEGRSNQNSFIGQGVEVSETAGVLRGAYKAVAGDYFGAAGIPLLAGRPISWEDIRARRPVGVVSETLAREFWGNADAAIGKRIRHTGDDPWREIIGVVGDVRDGGLRGAPRPVAFWPVLVEDFLGFDAWLRRDMAFVVRTERADPLALVGSIRDAVWSVNRNLPLADIGTLERVVQRDMAATTFTLSMLLVAAGVAVLLGAIGIYGVVSSVFEQRSREIGIRVALGATRRDVLAMVLRQGAIIGALGVTLGVVAAAVVTRLLTAQVFGVGTLDFATYAAAVALSGGIALLASYAPARRAARADPCEPLRQ